MVTLCRLRFAWRLVLGAGAVILLSGCVVTGNRVSPLEPENGAHEPGWAEKQAAKVHLIDGSVVLFAKGYTQAGVVLRGEGERYDLLRRTRTLVAEVPLADVAVVEFYHREALFVRTLAMNLFGFWLTYLGFGMALSNAPIM